MKSFGSYFPVVQTSPLDTRETQEWLMSSPLERWLSWRGFRQAMLLQGAVKAGHSALLLGFLKSDPCPGSVKPALLDPDTQGDISHRSGERPWHCTTKKWDTALLEEECKTGASCVSVLPNVGGLSGRYLKTSFSPWTFSSGLGFVATHWILVSQTAWAAAFSWKENYLLFTVLYFPTFCFVSKSSCRQCFDLRSGDARIHPLS